MSRSIFRDNPMFMQENATAQQLHELGDALSAAIKQAKARTKPAAR